ncbi:MAG TPA: hypothetical protein VE085_04995 [Burkholderiales bacterium]|nr:hypothetical protein [Burkholderiales bacterium]
MRALAALAVFSLTGCFAYQWDPHSPDTILASPQGGAVTVPHGSRLRLPLATDAEHEWRRVEPQILQVVAEGPADATGQTFTPVRTGDEKLRLEYKRLTGDAPAERSVTYDVSVPEETGIFSRFWARVRGKSSS